MNRRAWLAVALVLNACAPIEQRPPPEPTLRVVESFVDRPVPCFREEDRPIPPAPVPIDLEHATADQMSAALEANAIADARYMGKLEELFVKCMQVQGREIK